MPQTLKKKPSPTSSAPAADPALAYLTYEQFLEWDRENQHVEWVDGKVVEMAPISGEHSEVGRFLLSILSAFVETNDAGALRYEPFQMKTGPDLPGRSPDILFVAKKNLSRLKKNHLAGPADLVVEIISPGSRTVDRGEKYYEYEQGGVREYWLLDPLRKQAEFYRRGKDGFYRVVPISDDGIFRSAVLKGLWLKVAWLWQTPLPQVIPVLKEWGLV